MSKEIANILLKKWDTKNLGHFYILNSTSNTKTPNLVLEDFINVFIKEILIRENLIDLADSKSFYELGHPDILFIRPSKNNYVIDDFTNFFKFMNYNLYQLSWRFIIISEVNKLSPLIEHKLLKNLEEPPEKTTIFFLRPGNEKLLLTIESRAINFRISNPISKLENNQLVTPHNIFKILESAYAQDKDKLNILDLIEGYLLKDLKEHQFLEKFKTKSIDSLAFYSVALDFISHLPSNYKIIQNSLSEINWFLTSKDYNLQQNERILALLHAVSLNYNYLNINGNVSIDTP